MTSHVALLQTTPQPLSLLQCRRPENSGSWSNVLPHGMRQIPRNSAALLGSPDDPTFWKPLQESGRSSR